MKKIRLFLVNLVVVVLLEGLRVPIWLWVDSLEKVAAWTTSQLTYGLVNLVAFITWIGPLILIPMIVVYISYRMLQGSNGKMLIVFIFSEIPCLVGTWFAMDLWIYITGYEKYMNAAISGSNESSGTVFVLTIVNSLVVSIMVGILSKKVAKILK